MVERKPVDITRKSCTKNVKRMTKLLLVSDLHLLTSNLGTRRDNILEGQWKKLRYIYETARKKDAVVVQAGDFVDSPRSWVLLSRLISFFEEFEDITTYFVRGQHDIYMRSDSLTIMDVLMKIFSNIILLSEKPNKLSSNGIRIFLFGQSYVTNKVKYKVVKNAFNILVVHKPVSDTNLPYDHYNAKKFLRIYKDFNCILCGDIHKKFFISKGERRILNTGSLVRKRSSDGIPGFYILNPITNSYKFYNVNVEEDVFTTVTKDTTDDEFLDDFIDNLKKKEKTFITFSSRKKVLALVKSRKRYKGVKDVVLEIMNSVEEEA